MNYENLQTYFEEKQAEMLTVVEQLVVQETPSSDKARLNAFAEQLADRLRDAGAETEIVPSVPTRGHAAGNHVRGRFGPTNGKAPALVLCHFDTVWPVGALATHPFRIDGDGRAYGPGIFDMQTSLVLAEYAIHAVRDLSLTLPRPVIILMTSDEEVGSPTSRKLIEEEARAADYALVMESPLPGGVLKTARKGGGHFTVDVTGRAAHAGVEPEKGISAIQELAHQILALHALTDLARGSTVNVGVIEGGTVGNSVAAHARGLVDVRAWTQEEAERLAAAVRALEPVTPGAQVEISGGFNRLPLERTVTGDLFARARTIGAKLGLALEEGATGGGSDGNITGALGVPTLDGLGVPGHGAHADHEHIEVAEMPGRAALLVALLMEL